MVLIKKMDIFLFKKYYSSNYSLENGFVNIAVML